MAYMLPLRFIRVGPDTMICATKIICIMSTKCFQARLTLKSERLSKTLINACGKLSAKSAIFMDNGTVISSPLTVQRLQSAILKSNAKATEMNTPKQRRLRIYDVYDEPERPEIDEDYGLFGVCNPYKEETEEYDEELEEIEE